MTKLEYHYADAIHTICLCVFNSILLLFKAANETVLHLSHQIKRGAFCFEMMQNKPSVHLLAMLTLSPKY